MASKKENILDPAQARKELGELLDGFFQITSEDLRTKVLALIPAFHLLRQVGKSIVSRDMRISARDRILAYLQKYPMTVIDSDELMVVSGITDYQRRIRELRVQEGWPVLSGSTVKQMAADGEWESSGIDVSKIKADEYVMLTTGQDRDAAHRWFTLNSIRKEKTGVKEKLLKYFLENIGREITGEELAYLANQSKEWTRRTRELRTEDGWPVKTKSSGRIDLPIGVYVLEEARQAEVHDRKIDDSVRVQVLERDHFACRKCGWTLEKRADGDPRHLLELHHLDYHVDKGANTKENLITICNVHHDELHKNHMNREEVLKWIGSFVL